MERGARPLRRLQSHPPTRVLLISPAPPVAVIYLGVSAGIVLERPVGARTAAAANKLGVWILFRICNGGSMTPGICPNSKTCSPKELILLHVNSRIN